MVGNDASEVREEGIARIFSVGNAFEMKAKPV